MTKLDKDEVPQAQVKPRFKKRWPIGTWEDLSSKLDVERAKYCLMTDIETFKLNLSFQITLDSSPSSSDEDNENDLSYEDLLISCNKFLRNILN